MASNTMSSQTISDADKKSYLDACQSNLGEVKQLIEKHPTIVKDAVTVSGKTGFHVACMFGQLDIIQYFLKQDPKVVDLKDKSGQTGFHYVCSEVFHRDPKSVGIDIIQCILKVDPIVLRLEDKNGRTGFHYVCFSGKLDLVQFILKKDLTALYLKDKYGKTGFHLACEEGKLNVVKCLTKKDPTVLHVRDNSGNTGFHTACRNGNLYIVAYLLGVDPTLLCLKNNERNTALKIAIQLNREKIVTLLQKVEKGWQKLTEVKVLVVGDASVGKTTLLRSLKEGRGDDVGKTTSSTDGIEIGELYLGGVCFSCWDFAGQEMYHYTHQFFLSDDGIYLVLFNLSEPFISSISVQLTFWLTSIAQRAPSSQVLLIGTHASMVSLSHRRETTQQVRDLVSQKFKSVVVSQSKGESQKEEVVVLEVDSLSGMGKDQVRNALANLGEQKLERVPVGFEGIQQMLLKYQNTLRSSQPPVVQLKQLETIFRAHPEEYPLMKGVATSDWELALKVLHSLGRIVLIDCWGKEIITSDDEIMMTAAGSVVQSEGGGGKKKKEEEEEEGARRQEDQDHHHRSDFSHSSTIIVVLQPRWLAEMFKTVVTLTPNFVKDGMVSIERLKNLCWRGYPDSIHQLLLIALEQFGIVHQLGGDRGEGGKVIVPCLLPDCAPSNLGCLVQEDQQEALSLLLKKKSTPPLVPSSVSPLLPQYSPLRRSFLLEKESQQLPVGVMGKMLSSLLQWGKIQSVWKTGCVVVRSVDHLAAVVWEGWCGSSLGVHFVLFTGRGEEVNKPLQGEKSSSSSLYPLPPAKTINYLHQATQMMENLLGDYEDVNYKSITPCSVDEEGIPREWVELKDVFLALRHNKSTVRTVVVGSGSVEGEVKEKRGEVAVEGWLAPDYLLERVSVDFYEENDIVMGKLLRKESYGEVYLAEVKEMSCGGGDKGKKKTVAVKKIRIDEKKLVEEKMKMEDVLKELYAETFFFLKVQHPNVVRLVGMCKDPKPPLLLLELLDGDLFSSLMDPIAPLSVVGILRIAADTSQGLHYLHSLTPPLIHRDLKGANIFLTRSLARGSGQPEYASKNVLAKLGDFGHSSMLCGPYQLRAQGRIAHINPRWAAPEILEGRDYSIESDIYSMGLVLWETCYRKMAYHEIQEPFVDEIKEKVIKGLRPSLTGREAGQKALDKIIKNCWSIFPKDRPSAQAVYTSIHSLSSSIAPSLYEQLPPIVNPQQLFPPNHQTNNNNKDQIERYCVRQQVQLPDNKYGSCSHRVTCLAVCGDHVWGGCQSGYLFCSGGESLKSAAKGEGGKDSRGGGGVDLCHFSQLPHKATESSRVNTIIGIEKEGLVWVGFENGWLSLWQGVGGIIGEEMSFSSPLVAVRDAESIPWYQIMRRKNQIASLTLRYGELRWGEGEERSLSMKKVCQVKRIEEKSGGFVFWLLGEKEEPISPRFEVVSKEIWDKWVGLLEFIIFCFERKRVLKRVGEVDLSCGAMGGVLSLSGIDGRVWSVDGSLEITEWLATPDLTGLQKWTFSVTPLRSLTLSTLYPHLSSKNFGCFFSVGDQEIWVVCGKTVYALDRTSILEKAQKEGGKEEGTLEMGREWKLFGEEGGEREEVCCGVYCDFTKEAWLGTSEGYVWRKGKSKSGLMERKEVGGGGVTAMAIVGNQIWCGTISGAIHQFGLFSFGSLLEEKEEEKGANPHTHTISSIVVQSSQENLRVWVGSEDLSFSLWTPQMKQKKNMKQLISFLKGGNLEVSLEEFHLYFECFLENRHNLFNQLSGTLTRVSKLFSGVWLVSGKVQASDGWEGVDEIEFVQKTDEENERGDLSVNERECFDYLYSSLSLSSGTEGAEYVVWLFAFHSQDSFLMWPHAPTCLEHCKPAPPNSLMRWSQHVLSGLTFLHSHGVVHRDIHPKNILITEFSIALICDLESTAEIPDQDKWTEIDDSERRGRPGYVAPEFLSPGLYSSRTDVWGFCATICVSFTGLEERLWMEGGQWRSRTHLDNLSEYEETALTKSLKSVLVNIKWNDDAFVAPKEVYWERPLLSELKGKWPTKVEDFQRKKRQ